jgi:hypothetical protein
MMISAYKGRHLLLMAFLGGAVLAGIVGNAVAGAQTQVQAKAIRKSSSDDVPDGALDITDLWPSQVQSAVETDTLALQPALSVTGGNGGASFPSFTGDPDFDGDTFEVNGQDDIVIPYFQMADQMRLDFEDGHQLQGPPEQPTKAAIKRSTSPKLSRKAAIIAKKENLARFHGAVFWHGGNSILNASPFVLAGDPASPPPRW